MVKNLISMIFITMALTILVTGCATSNILDLSTSSKLEQKVSIDVKASMELVNQFGTDAGKQCVAVIKPIMNQIDTIQASPLVNTGVVSRLTAGLLIAEKINDAKDSVTQQCAAIGAKMIQLFMQAGVAGAGS